MAKRGRPPKHTGIPKVPAVKLNLHSDTKQSLAIVVTAFLSLLSLLSLLNVSGNLGQIAIKALRVTFGWGAFLLPVFFLLIAFALYKDLKDRDDEKKT